MRATPISLQAKRARSKESWKAEVREASLAALPKGNFATGRPIAVTIYAFTAVLRTAILETAGAP